LQEKGKGMIGFAGASRYPKERAQRLRKKTKMQNVVCVFFSFLESIFRHFFLQELKANAIDVNETQITGNNPC
jgi:hypothetical protein